MSDLYPIHLNNIDFDCTADSDGVTWAWESLDGWFDSPEVVIAELGKSPDGVTFTAGRNAGRPIVLKGSAVVQGGNHPSWFRAVNTLNAAMNIVTAPSLLTVDELIPTQAYVRRVGRTRTGRVARIDGGANRAALTFEVPLKASDPRKYAQTALTNVSLALIGAATAIGSTFTVIGTADTTPVFTIDGPLTTLGLTNSTTGYTLQWNGTLAGGDTLVVDFSTHSILKNGVNAFDLIEPTSIWWTLAPGSNSLIFNRASGSGNSTAQFVYRPAWI